MSTTSTKDKVMERELSNVWGEMFLSEVAKSGYDGIVAMGFYVLASIPHSMN